MRAWSKHRLSRYTWFELCVKYAYDILVISHAECTNRLKTCQPKLNNYADCQNKPGVLHAASGANWLTDVHAAVMSFKREQIVYAYSAATRLLLLRLVNNPDL